MVAIKFAFLDRDACKAKIDEVWAEGDLVISRDVKWPSPDRLEAPLRECQPTGSGVLKPGQCRFGRRITSSRTPARCRGDACRMRRMIARLAGLTPFAPADDLSKLRRR